MGQDFQPRLSVLPASQRRFWDEFVGVPREFVLYGGTALALHLGHRTSIDFDFFGDRAFEPARLASTNPQLTVKALSFFGDGNLHRLPRDVQDRLARAAREVDLDRLPGIADLVRSFEQDLSTKP
jgi:hypothetical protein